MNNRLKKYIRDLIILGFAALISGVFFAKIILESNQAQDWNIIYLPLKILGVLITYFLINHIGPGGAVTMHFTDQKPNEDERLLNKLIAKYRNKILIALPALIYITFDLVIGISKYQLTLDISLDSVFFYLVFPFFFVGAMMQGVKYISAWWNIQNALREDPRGEKMIEQVKNDPSLSKLDNPKPLINLPQIIKKLFNTK